MVETGRMTRAAGRARSGSGRQEGSQNSISSESEIHVNSHVHLPPANEMSIDQMEEALVSGQLTGDEVRTIRTRFEQAKESQQLLDEVRGFKKRRTTSKDARDNIDDSNSDSDDDQSRPRKSFDLKYKNVETLRITSSIREWTDWKDDLQKKFDGAPRRFGTDQARVIGANDSMDKNCRSLWNTVVRDDPSKASNWNYFISWTRNLIMDNANFDAGIYDLHDQARQRFGQKPTDFNGYLSSLEREMRPVSEE
ncbi:hypothetical protein V1509DRAFT_185670, partial [Lipomyces kononenkoae]